MLDQSAGLCLQVGEDFQTITEPLEMWAITKLVEIGFKVRVAGIVSNEQGIIAKEREIVETYAQPVGASVETH